MSCQPWKLVGRLRERTGRIITPIPSKTRAGQHSSHWHVLRLVLPGNIFPSRGVGRKVLINHSMRQLQIEHVMKTTPASSPTFFAELMRHPEKLEAALAAASRENEAFAASRIFGPSSASRSRQNASSKPENYRKASNGGFAELPK